MRYEACPLCLKQGLDSSQDNLAVYDDGHTYCYAGHGIVKASVVEAAHTYEFLPHRSISKEAMEFFDIKTKVNSDGRPISQSFRYPNGASKTRPMDRKEFFWTTDGDPSTAGLFGLDKFSEGSHKYVTITEGEYDAAALWQVLRAPVVSVQSSSTAGRDCAVARSWLNSFERIYIAFDGDAAGRDAAASVAKLFDYNKIYLVKFTRYKDANDYVKAGKSDELKHIWWNSKPYLPDAIVSSFSDFQSILTEKNKPSISYPFPTLTEKTYGIRTGESILITALEGVGKTELMHSIEFHLLRETNDPIAAIFLEEPKRRHLQALAGLQLQRPAHLPTSGLSDVEVFEAVKSVIGQDDRLHLYSHFGSVDPDQILDHIRFLVAVRGCRYVLLDHIGMVVSGLLGDDERRALDYLSTRSEMMVKELDFALIMASHVNDNGDTRGSRMIAKVCDIRIDLQRDLREGSNITHLNISKNRFCGRTGPAGDLTFNPFTYSLSEMQDGHPNTQRSFNSRDDLPYTESPGLVPGANPFEEDVPRVVPD